MLLLLLLVVRLGRLGSSFDRLKSCEVFRNRVLILPMHYEKPITSS